jgi:hypothetical protein
MTGFIHDSSPLTIKKIEDVKLMVKTHRGMREEINSLAGVYPLISLSITFTFSCSFFVMSVVKELKIDVASMEYVFTLLLNITMILILSLSPNDNDGYLKIISWISQDNSQDNSHLNHEKSILVNYLHSLISNPIQHNACDLFLINKKFLLNFIGSLIPFCVMFIQIFQAAKK